MESKAEQSQKAILEAAIDRFGANGYRATSVAEIARTAEVSGSLAYVYFADKADLFRAALDRDAAEVITEGAGHIFIPGSLAENWPETTLLSLIRALDHHPLTRRVLAGLEPHVTSRMLSLPALDELRSALARQLDEGQKEGTIRPDIDPPVMARGAVYLWIVLLMGVVQFGLDDIDEDLRAVRSFFEVSLRP